MLNLALAPVWCGLHINDLGISASNQPPASDTVAWTPGGHRWRAGRFADKQDRLASAPGQVNCAGGANITWCNRMQPTGSGSNSKGCFWREISGYSEHSESVLVDGSLQKVSQWIMRKKDHMKLRSKGCSLCRAFVFTWRDPLFQTLTEPNPDHDVMLCLERSSEAQGDTHVAKGQKLRDTVVTDDAEPSPSAFYSLWSHQRGMLSLWSFQRTPRHPVKAPSAGPSLLIDA